MDEEGRKKKKRKKWMTVSLGISLASGGRLFVELWEAQSCLWDPE